jgi:hypothetical protein
MRKRTSRRPTDVRAGSRSSKLRVECDAHEVHRAPRAELVFEFGTMVGDRLPGEIKLFGDFGYRPTGRDQPQDLEFARAEV